MRLRIAILTVSDRVSRGEMIDEGGPSVRESLKETDWQVVATAVVPDEVNSIVERLISWSDEAVDIILTTGGTGLGPRDVTPEATMQASARIVPGIGDAIRNAGMAQTPHAMLSRGIAVTRGTTLIVNLPGSPRGAADGIAVVSSVLEHAVATLRGAKH